MLPFRELPSASNLLDTKTVQIGGNQLLSLAANIFQESQCTCISRLCSRKIIQGIYMQCFPSLMKNSQLYESKL